MIWSILLVIILAGSAIALILIDMNLKISIVKSEEYYKLSITYNKIDPNKDSKPVVILKQYNLWKRKK